MIPVLLLTIKFLTAGALLATGLKWAKTQFWWGVLTMAFAVGFGAITGAASLIDGAQRDTLGALADKLLCAAPFVVACIADLKELGHRASDRLLPKSLGPAVKTTGRISKAKIRIILFIKPSSILFITYIAGRRGGHHLLVWLDSACILQHQAW